jgi:hypothetical protein
MSAEARKRIAEAQRKRWAALKQRKEAEERGTNNSAPKPTGKSAKKE